MSGYFVVSRDLFCVFWIFTLLVVWLSSTFFFFKIKFWKAFYNFFRLIFPHFFFALRQEFKRSKRENKRCHHHQQHRHKKHKMTTHTKQTSMIMIFAPLFFAQMAHVFNYDTQHDRNAASFKYAFKQTNKKDEKQNFFFIQLCIV